MDTPLDTRIDKPIDPPMGPLKGLELLAEHGCFGGVQRFYRHSSEEVGLPMRFGIYLPPQALQQPGMQQQASAARVPLLTCLAGLTCNEETFASKAGAQRSAAHHGIALLMPDTSPRGAGVAGEDHHWEFGVGAGFYLNATQSPWSGHWCMESYLVRELIPGVAAQFGLDGQRLGLLGHSMGGHGALTLALRHPGRFASVSALAPICAPSQCHWGRQAFTGYLGQDESTWAAHDASQLMARCTTAPYPLGILVDQGLADQFLADELHPEALEAACLKAGQPLTLRRHAGYDHGYFFIASFMADHLRHHADALLTGA